MTRLQDIYIYPVKSLGGIRQTEWQVLERGFQFDRRWMLVDQNGEFISQRTEHKLAMLKTDLLSGCIRVSNKRSAEESITLPLNPQSAGNIKVNVWDDSVIAHHVSEEIDVWFSKYLGKTCRLVWMPETGSRPIDKKYATKNEQVSFADTFPYLLISQASLDDLNSRLNKPVPMNRFRPNLVISRTEPFEEDSWSEIKIGEVHFQVSKPCARCILTTVDQETGIKGKEPIRTLSTYRSSDNNILFGQNLIALNEGLLRVTDPVEIISYKQAHD